MHSKHLKLPHVFLNHMFPNKVTGIKASHIFILPRNIIAEWKFTSLLTTKHINLSACFSYIWAPKRYSGVSNVFFTWRTYYRFVISSFCPDADEICAVLGYYEVSNGNPLLTVWDNVSVPSSRIKKLKMGPICCPEMLVKDYHLTLRNTPEDCRSYYRFACQHNELIITNLDMCCALRGSIYNILPVHWSWCCHNIYEFVSFVLKDWLTPLSLSTVLKFVTDTT
jgi:hypothetical protein